MGRQRRHASRGFTLVELAAVVFIVSILATLAIISYRRLIVSSHTSEGVQLVQSVKAAQETYKSETGTYADISMKLVAIVAGAPNAETYPAQTPGQFKTVWGDICKANCYTSGPQWVDLPVHIDGPVLYGVSTVAGFNTNHKSTDTMPTVSGNGKPLGTVTIDKPATDWFLVTAIGDANGNGEFSYVLGSSINNQVLVDNDGE
jgi:prepilin-type N-terminal cleavage/methylation domain-containing protein